MHDIYVPNRYAEMIHGVGLGVEYPVIYYPEDHETWQYSGTFMEGMTVCVESYMGEENGKGSEQGGRPTQAAAFQRYQINVLVDNGGTDRVPVVYENNPTYQNLIGRIENYAENGTLTTNFSLIKSGALHRANGGYLILEARDVLGGIGDPPSEIILIIQGGLVVHVGCGDGKLTAAIGSKAGYLVQGLDTDPIKVQNARSHLRSLGQQGHVTVREFDGEPVSFTEDAHYSGVYSSHNIVINEGSTFAFVVGASFSLAVGQLGMRMAVEGNVRYPR